MEHLTLFLVTAPGLEKLLAQEATEAGFEVTETTPGGVSLQGNWQDVQRANLTLRGATRVLVRLTAFRAMHLAQLDKRARKLPWADWLRPDVPVRVETTCRKSRIYHDRAANQRIEKALIANGYNISKSAPVGLKVRIEDDLCTLSVDTSGAPLHKRGIKQQVNKAPMRETLAALFLRACGYDGTQTVYDPMCGSGTFPIEAAEIAAGVLPGRMRDFGFEHLAIPTPAEISAAPKDHGLTFYGTDRDAGAVKMAKANADRAGVTAQTQFSVQPISDAMPPDGPPGLVIVNPPYGGRVGNKKPLYGLYSAFGTRMKNHFKGWRVGMITSDAGLAKTTGLPWDAPGPFVDHGGIKIRLWQTQL